MRPSAAASRSKLTTARRIDIDVTRLLLPLSDEDDGVRASMILAGLTINPRPAEGPSPLALETVIKPDEFKFEYI